ncbi:protein phosphatase 2C domain-containing protein [Thalassobacillus sp. CUG 92003]|uniref:protein phosphatase 2C domain-containing protein n=1 Tax=Thalassobacillus sp. CUG 92003 TaxID=2736641 RepID=UPI0015E633D9|nr:protein phosphatase 2C domain-containing protein [Thalassobacillus sp. CUG 92003]
MKIESYTYKGVGSLNEDALIINQEAGIFGVADGVSSLVPYKNKNGHTGGYLAAHIIKSQFESLHVCYSLYDQLGRVNHTIREKMHDARIELSKKEQLWGAALAIVQVTEQGITYIQTGDCMAVVVYRDGHVRPLTISQLSHLEKKGLEKWKEGVDSGITNREELMAKVKETLIHNKYMSNTKEGYGVLNGDQDAMAFTEYGKINQTGITHMILLSDGLFLPEDLIPQYRHYWEYTVDQILQKGLERYTHELIKEEEADADCVKYPRFKVSDDKAGVVLHF